VWDFTRAYNGKSNSIEYGKYQIAVKTGLGNRYKVLLNLAKIGDNDYSATWEDQDGKITTDNNIELNSLYDLYKLLGAERTVKINK